MVNQILTGAGFVLNETYKETRFLKPPITTYAIYNDDISARGADYINLIKDHDYTIELYEYKPDREAEKRIEDQLDARGIEYEKESRYWIDEEQIYQVIYNFSFIEKRGELE